MGNFVRTKCLMENFVRCTKSFHSLFFSSREEKRMESFLFFSSREVRGFPSCFSKPWDPGPEIKKCKRRLKLEEAYLDYTIELNLLAELDIDGPMT